MTNTTGNPVSTFPIEPAFPAAKPVAEICSAGHDDAEFGERAIAPLCDLGNFEYGTKLYASPVMDAHSVTEKERLSLIGAAGFLLGSGWTESAAILQRVAGGAPMLVAQPQLHAALFAARGALQHMKEGGKPTQSLLNEAIAAIDSVALTQAAPAAVAVPDEREALQDGEWYWIEKEGWHGNPPTIAPALYKAECDAWYSFAFGGIPTRQLKVLEPCLLQARAALAATPAAAPVVLPEPVAWRWLPSAVLKEDYCYTDDKKRNEIRNGMLEDAGWMPSEPLYTEQQVRALLATGGQAQAVQPITGPCGQCKSSIQPCDCAISTILKERGLVAVDATHYSKVSAQAKAAAPQAQADARDAERYRWVKQQAEFFPLVMDGTGLLCAEAEEAEEAIDAAIAAAKGE